MKKHVSAVCLAVILLLGIGLLLYPAVSDYWNSLHQSRAIAAYAGSVADINAERRSLLLMRAEEYNHRLAASGSDFLLSEDQLTEYNGLLDVDDSGIIGYIEIGRIGCSLPIYHGTEASVLQIAVGHIAGSSLPIGGEGTHCVLSGHRGLPSARIFTDLDKLTEGDTFAIFVLGDELTYEVDDIRTVIPSEIGSLKIEAGKDLCTLVTCTPYGVNTHRLLVRGHRVENSGAVSVRVGADALLIDKTVTAPFFALPIIIVWLVVTFVRANAKEKRGAVRRKLGLK